MKSYKKFSSRKKCVLACIIAMVVMSLFFCISSQGVSGNQGISLTGGLDSGWADDDAFQFIAVGISKRGTLPPQDEKTACEAALLHAQFQAIEKLADAGIASVKGTVKVTREKGTIMQEVRGFVRGGKVVSSRFDPETKSCRIIFEIREKGMKRKVIEAASK